MEIIEVKGVQMNTPTTSIEKLSDTLDVGCGPHCLPGAVGIDQFQFDGVQFVHDLNQAPWPLPNLHFKQIRCQHVIEHVSNLKVLVKEMHRVSQAGASVKFITPHYSSYASWGDPTHLHHFALGSIPQLFSQVLTQNDYRVKSNGLKFTGSGLDFFGWIIYKMSPKKYEKHFAWIFPCNEIHTEIEFLK